MLKVVMSSHVLRKHNATKILRTREVNFIGCVNELASSMLYLPWTLNLSHVESLLVAVHPVLVNLMACMLLCFPPVGGGRAAWGRYNTVTAAAALALAGSV
jgi:hypothetical protein